MAKCPGCQREMLQAEGCVLNVAVYRAKTGTKNEHRVRFGEGKGFEVAFQYSLRCSDCGTTAGHFHHCHGVKEECARCRWQLVFCRCEDREFAGYQQGFIQ